MNEQNEAVLVDGKPCEGRLTIDGYEELKYPNHYREALRLFSSMTTELISYEIWPDAKDEASTLGTELQPILHYSSEDILRMTRAVSGILKIREDVMEFLPRASFLEEEIERSQKCSRSKHSPSDRYELQRRLKIGRAHV